MTIHEPNLGCYFEDFKAGDIFKHWPGRTIVDADNVWFSLLTNNSHPVHSDYNYSKDQMFGKPLVNSTLTLAIVAGMTVRDSSQNAIANLGWEDIQMPNPVFVGDTIYSETEILDVRESRSRAEAGIVAVRTSGYNQENKMVMNYKRTFMVKKKGYDDDKIKTFGTSEKDR